MIKLDYKLSNPKTNEITQKVYNYICDNFGINMISAQQEAFWRDSAEHEIDYIYEVTGKYPAMRGLDYIHSDFKRVNKRSIDWWNRGGLVTICWHTGINGYGYKECKEDVPDFDKLLDESTPEHRSMIENWDKAAKALCELQEAGVPVLWRPFHEFDGDWFWWSKGGSEVFIKLWRMMYDRFTNQFGLNNLIWVLGYDIGVKDGWYPGYEYCDILGADVYNSTTCAYSWPRLEKLCNTKPLAFHECGHLPKFEDFERDGCVWSWFMIWHTRFLFENDKENLKYMYNHPRVITLDRLPKF